MFNRQTRINTDGGLGAQAGTGPPLGRQKQKRLGDLGPVFKRPAFTKTEPSERVGRHRSWLLLRPGDQRERQRRDQTRVGDIAAVRVGVRVTVLGEKRRCVMNPRWMSRRVPACWSSEVACYLTVIATAVLACSCGSSAGAAQPASGVTGAVAASCVGLTAREKYRSARLVFDGRMLAGATVGAGGHRVLSSPARVAVTRYLKGHGPRIVRVQTAVTTTSNGVTENSEGILPRVGERWRIFTDRSRQPLPTSDCNGSRRLR